MYIQVKHKCSQISKIVCINTAEIFLTAWNRFVLKKIIIEDDSFMGYNALQSR
jgi:hypothetical protein